MNDPIDILEIAEDRYAKALAYWQQFKVLSLTFDIPDDTLPRLAGFLDVARADLWVARAMSHDLSLAEFNPTFLTDFLLPPHI